MNQGQELVLTDFGRFLPQEELSNHPKINPVGWKSFAISAILLFSLVSWPWQGTAEAVLTADNLLYLVNEDRAKEGLTPLRISYKLSKAASDKARDMLDKGYFAHISPEGLEAWDFIKTQEFEYLFAGENLAINYTNPYELQKDFMQSSSHRENILSKTYSEIGIAVVSGSFQDQPAVITVEVFASPAP